MSARAVHRPWTRRVSYGPWLVALAVLIATVLLARRAAPSAEGVLPLPAGPPAVTRALTALERAWVDSDLPATYVVASHPQPLWCPEALVPPRRWSWQRRSWQADVLAAWRRRDTQALIRARDEHRREWLPALALADRRLRERDLDAAEAAFTHLRDVALKDRLYLAGRAAERLRVLEDEGQPLTGTERVDDALLATIYVQHVIGSLRLERNLAGAELWDPLKRAIGSAKLVLLVRHGDVLTERQRALPAPGCADEGALHTHDLYNNLIVAYLKAQDFQPNDKGRTRELARKYSARTEPLAHNPWFAALRLLQNQGPFAAAVSNAAGSSARPASVPSADAIAREARLWALSNAERILRTTQGRTPPYPDDARLCTTLAQATEAALDDLPAEAPAELLEALDPHVLALTQHARVHVAQLDAAQQARAAQAWARLALLAAVRTGAVERARQALAPGTGDWTQAQQATVALLEQTLPLRHDAQALAREVLPAPADAASLARPVLPDEPRAQAWRSAARSDLAASLAHAAAQVRARERPRLAAQARALLQPGDDTPVELRDLENSLGVLRLLDGHTQTLLAGTLLALLAWLATRWLLLQLRARHDLFASFYRLEALARVRHERGRGPSR
jgi:hypothetical protein